MGRDKRRVLDKILVRPEWPVSSDVDRNDKAAVKKLVTQVFQAYRKQRWEKFGHLSVGGFVSTKRMRQAAPRVRRLQRVIESRLNGDVRMRRVIFIAGNATEIKLADSISDLYEAIVDNAPLDRE